MPAGITRFIIFFDGQDKPGRLWLDDVSIVPVEDQPLIIPADAPVYGMSDRRQMVWIWAHDRLKLDNAKMSIVATREVEPETVRFRKTFTYPVGARDPKVVFLGDDHAVLSLDGRVLADNWNAQNLLGVSLDDLAPGEHTVEFEAENQFGVGGLLARVQWFDAAGKRVLISTNTDWECSVDDGKNWQTAKALFPPVPASPKFARFYPHLEALNYELSGDLPEGIERLRIAVRVGGGFQIELDGQPVFDETGAGQIVRADLSGAASGSKKMTLRFADIVQPPAGQATIQYRVNDEWKELSLADFRDVAGQPAAPVKVLFPDRSLSTNIGAFEAAATRPTPVITGSTPTWAVAWLENAQDLWTLGADDDESTEFAELSPVDSADLARAFPATTAPRDFPRGLEGKWRPEVSIDFALTQVPETGAVFLLDVEDADAMVCTVGVFANGVLCATPQVLGYDQVPGRWKTQRGLTAWVPPGLLRVGANRLTLRLLSSYNAVKLDAPLNQAEEYIRLNNLRPRSENPYPTAQWLHWDHLRLAAPQTLPDRHVNGRPARLGTQYGYLALGMSREQLDWILRDTAWLGLTHTAAPIRIGVWDEGQFKGLLRADQGFSEAETSGDALLQGLVNLGIRPYLLLEPGRHENLDQLDGSFAARVIQRFGRYIDALETGNEVDHPYYNFNALSMSAAYGSIMKSAVVAQALKRFMPEGRELAVMGQGWYHAWDYGVIDAHARKEADNDPAWTDELAAHDYGKSYIQPAVEYYLTYGVLPPKPIWVTECGSWTANDTEIGDFELNLRGNLAYVDNIAQYLLYPYNTAMERFSMLSKQSGDAAVLEKARCFRRLALSHSLLGKPLLWEPNGADAEAALRDRNVLISAVDAGAAVKVALVNNTHEPVQASVRVHLPKAGTWQAIRYADAAVVSEGISELTIEAAPTAVFTTPLKPGEAVEYLLTAP
jgi:hypothetical protein